MFRHLYRCGRSSINASLRSVEKRSYCDKSLKPVGKTGETVVDEPLDSIHRCLYEPKNFERKMLVWVGKYKTVEEVPRTVPYQTMERARNKARIKLSNYMILATIVGCAFMVWEGKKAAGRGETVSKMNTDWHKAVNEGRA